MAKTVMGECNICGNYTDLDYEHVPPESAFNNRLVIVTTSDEYWNRGQGEGKKPRGEYLRRGHGLNSICMSCNRTTGRLYAKDFADWCGEGREYMAKTGGRGAVLHFARIRPLPILKQITTMFLAMNGNRGFNKANQALVKFVLDREAMYLPPKYRFWVYYVAPGPLRRTPFNAALNIHTGKSVAGMEFSFPPFGYQLTLDDPPEDKRLFEISSFSRYRYFEPDRMTLNLAVLPNHGPAMGDYRSFGDVKEKDGETHYYTPFG